jgi:zinc protease
MRGTKNKNRQQIQDETDRLKAQINVSGNVSTPLRRTSARWRRTWPIPCALPGNFCASPPSPKANSSRFASKDRRRRKRQDRTEHPGPAGPEPALQCPLPARRHALRPTIDEQIEDLKKVTLDDARQFYWQFYGAGEGEIVISGQFDPDQMKKLVTNCLAIGRAPAATSASRQLRQSGPDQRQDRNARQAERAFPGRHALEDERRGSRLSGSHYCRHGLRGLSQLPPLPTHSRQGRFELRRLRGLLGTDKGRRGPGSPWMPLPRRRICRKWRPTSTRNWLGALKDGFTADEVEKAKKTWLDQRSVARTEDGPDRATR